VRLKRLLAGDECITAPGVGDALSARIASQELGFPVIFVSGFYVTASLLGLPDADMLGFAEMVTHLQRIRAAAPGALIIADGDTGYGGPAQVKRMVRGFGNAGVACILVEDQEAPKQCGHTEGKRVVSFAEGCTRIQAAVDARNEMGERGPLIMARTDARILGQAEAHRRGKAYKDIGADVLFLEAPLSEEDMRADNEALPDIPKLANMVEWAKTPQIGKAKLNKLGYKIAIYPVTMLNASIGAMYHWCKRLRDGEGDNDKQVEPSPPEACSGAPALMAFKDLTRMVGFPGYLGDMKRYGEIQNAVDKDQDVNGPTAKRARTQ
jgi:2-methylisocitrate lyase-like PEP mutase family enzyme